MTFHEHSHLRLEIEFEIVSLGRLRAIQHWEVAYRVGISMHLNPNIMISCTLRLPSLAGNLLYVMILLIGRPRGHYLGPCRGPPEDWVEFKP